MYRSFAALIAPDLQCQTILTPTCRFCMIQNECMRSNVIVMLLLIALSSCKKTTTYPADYRDAFIGQYSGTCHILSKSFATHAIRDTIVQTLTVKTTKTQYNYLSDTTLINIGGDILRFRYSDSIKTVFDSMPYAFAGGRFTETAIFFNHGDSIWWLYDNQSTASDSVIYYYAGHRIR
jgi:hypothetical protein